MTVDWARGGPDLLVTLDRDAGQIGLQIQEQLRAAIRDRRLGAGERLPSTRRLAELLGVSRGTVVDAYEQLLAEGWVESAVGSGTRVAAMPAGGPTRPRTGAVLASPSSPRPAVADFEYGIPDLGSVPLRAWSWAVSEATRTLPTAQLGDEDLAGSRHLRAVVTAYHRRVRSGCAVAEDAIVVSGFRQGLAFALATLAQHGIERIALEDPGPREHDVIARRAGMDAVPVPVDDHGLDVDRLRGTGARAVLLTPAHQCPTGVALGPSRRRDLIAWADEVDGVILEDDYDAEFRYDRQPVGSLQALDPDRVIALGSVSKTLAPAIRLGWVLAPARFVEGIVEEKRLSSRGAPGLDQEALALLVERAASTGTCDAFGRSTAHAGTCSQPRPNSPSGRIGYRAGGRLSRPAAPPRRDIRACRRGDRGDHGCRGQRAGIATGSWPQTRTLNRNHARRSRARLRQRRRAADPPGHPRAYPGLSSAI